MFPRLLSQVSLAISYRKKSTKRSEGTFTFWFLLLYASPRDVQDGSLRALNNLNDLELESPSFKFQLTYVSSNVDEIIRFANFYKRNPNSPSYPHLSLLCKETCSLGELCTPSPPQRQTKDSRLGALCPSELIRKRDFENSNDIMFASVAAPKTARTRLRVSRRIPRRVVETKWRITRNRERKSDTAERGVGVVDGIGGRMREERERERESGILGRNGRVRRNIPSKTFHSTRE